MMKFYKEFSTEQTYNVTQNAVVSTQLALIMEPLHQYDPNLITET